MKKPANVPLKDYIISTLAARHERPVSEVTTIIDWQFKRINQALATECRSVEISGFCRLTMHQKAIVQLMIVINRQAKYFLNISPTHPRLPRLFSDFELLDSKLDDDVREQFFIPGERRCGRMEERPPQKTGSGDSSTGTAPNLPAVREELPERPQNPAT